jgi:phosphoribosylformylglycinamidine cyclo-ligase
VFDLVRDVGRVSQPDLEATLNQGVGMVVVLPESEVDAAVRLLAERDLAAWVCGSVTAAGDPAGVSLVGEHPPS